MNSAPSRAQLTLPPVGVYPPPHLQENDALDLTQPGPEHSQLMKWVGSWDVDFTHWDNPGEAEKRATGRSIITAVFNGRYLHEEYSSDSAGRRFMGIGTIGYDRAARRFVTTWYDNTGTGITHLTGTAMREGQEITYHGAMVCAKTQNEVHIRQVVSWESNDRFTVTMFKRSAGRERKTMELVYSRQA